MPLSVCLPLVCFFFLSPSFSGDLQPLRGGNAEARHSPASETLAERTATRGAASFSPTPSKKPAKREAAWGF